MLVAVIVNSATASGKKEAQKRLRGGRISINNSGEARLIKIFTLGSIVGSLEDRNLIRAR